MYLSLSLSSQYLTLMGGLMVYDWPLSVLSRHVGAYKMIFLSFGRPRRVLMASTSSGVVRYNVSFLGSPEGIIASSRAPKSRMMIFL